MSRLVLGLGVSSVYERADDQLVVERIGAASDEQCIFRTPDS